MPKNVFAIIAVLVADTAVPSQNLVLWYSKPAVRWSEAPPIGSGRLG
jgi:alpha-L-fucosidase 2